MRHIVLSEDGVNPVENAHHRLMAACFFPESPRDQQQVLCMAAIEQEESRTVGEASYKPSETMQAVAKLIEKRTTQLYSAGFVGVSYVWLQNCGLRPSLNRASIIASRAAFEFGNISWRPGLDPKAAERARPVTGDAATLERIFRKYRSVAHICAARVSAGGYLDHLHIWDHVPEVVAAMIQTSASFQVALERATDTSRWNLWDVTRYFPSALGDAALLAPDGDLLYWIERGYLSAMEEGLLPRQNGGSIPSPG